MTDLDSAAEALYALPPSELDGFGARRAELVAEARASGDRELARKLGALKKPVQAAALANGLVRSQPGVLAELSRLGSELRDAHRHLRGGELRELSERRQRLLNRLTALGRQLAGRPVGETVLNQLRATFEAAIADQAAEQAVLSGRLTTALSYSGFGEVDLSDAVALPRRLTVVPDLPAEPAELSEPAGPEQRIDPAVRQRAERALLRAESASEAAQRAVLDAADRLVEAAEQEREVADRIEALQLELATARDQAAGVAEARAAADREHARAQRAAERAERALRQAAAELEQLAQR